MNKALPTLTLFTLGAIASVATPCFALTVSKVSLSQESVDTNKPVSISLTFAEDPRSVNCGISVNWGNGRVERIRVGATQQLRPPFVIENSYPTPGSYKVSVEGETIPRGLNTLFGCNVKYQSTVLVKQPGQEPRATEAQIETDATSQAARQQAASIPAEPPKASTAPQTLAGATRQESSPGQSASNQLKTGISYSPAALSHDWITTWGKRDQFGDNRRTLFRCVAFNTANTPILRGNEMSWRSSEADSRVNACSVWADLTKSVLTGNKLTKIKSETESENQTFVTATFEDVAALRTTLINLSQDSYAGWYEVKGDNRFFSLGTFASPLKNKPSSGVANYKGDLTLERSSTLSDVEVTADFSKNQILIKAKFVDTGRNKGSVETATPITFDPDTGVFKGELVQTTYRPMLPPPNHIVSNKIAIGGVIGGDRGNVVAATLYTGFQARGFDFLVMKRE